MGARVGIKATLELGALEPADLLVEVYYGLRDTTGNIAEPVSVAIDSGRQLEGSRYEFSGDMACEQAGQYGFAVRALPQHADLPRRFLPERIVWS